MVFWITAAALIALPAVGLAQQAGAGGADAKGDATSAKAQGGEGSKMIPGFGMVPTEPQVAVLMEVQGEKKEISFESSALPSLLKEAGYATFGDLARLEPSKLKPLLIKMPIVLVRTGKWGYRSLGEDGRSEPVPLGKFHSRLPYNVAKLVIYAAKQEKRSKELSPEALKRALNPRRIEKIRGY